MACKYGYAYGCTTRNYPEYCCRNRRRFACRIYIDAYYRRNAYYIRGFRYSIIACFIFGRSRIACDCKPYASRTRPLGQRLDNRNDTSRRSTGAPRRSNARMRETLLCMWRKRVSTGKRHDGPERRQSDVTAQTGKTDTAPTPNPGPPNPGRGFVGEEHSYAAAAATMDTRAGTAIDRYHATDGAAWPEWKRNSYDGVERRKALQDNPKSACGRGGAAAHHDRERPDTMGATEA